MLVGLTGMVPISRPHLGDLWRRCAAYEDMFSFGWPGDVKNLAKFVKYDLHRMVCRIQSKLVSLRCAKAYCRKASDASSQSDEDRPNHETKI